MRKNDTKFSVGISILLSAVIGLTGCKRELLSPETFLRGLKQLATSNMATAVTLLPEADAYVQDGPGVNTNYGASAWLITKDDAPGYRREIYLRFDLAALPAMVSTIQSAQIELAGGVVNKADTANAKWVYYVVPNNSWEENRLNWNNAPTVGTKLGEIDGKLKTASSVVSFDIPAEVLQIAVNSDKKLSIKIVALRKTAGSVSFYSDFQSKENQNTQLQPKLHINYTTAENGYYSNLVMDKLTFDSIQMDLGASPAARFLINNQITAKADAALALMPNPVSKISDTDGKNKVQTDAARVFALALQYFLFQRKANTQLYIEKAKEFLLAWAAVNVAVSQTPDESMYLPFLTGYSLIRARMDTASRATGIAIVNRRLFKQLFPFPFLAH